MKWLSIEEWVVDRTWVRIYMILKKNGEKWEGAYFGWKLSAETFAYENGISVQEMPETAEHRIDEYGFHQRELRKEREGRENRERDEVSGCGAFRFEFENWGGTCFSPLQKYHVTWHGQYGGWGLSLPSRDPMGRKFQRVVLWT